MNKFGDAVNWDGAALNEQPIVVYDMSGKMLFYLFPVEREGVRIGDIKVAASKVLGSPIQVVGTSSPEEFSMPDIQRRTREIVAGSFKGYKILNSRVVVYDYPAMGLLVEVLDPQTGKTSRLLIDTNKNPDYSIISDDPTFRSTFLKNSIFHTPAQATGEFFVIRRSY